VSEETSIEQRLDSWAVDYLEAAIQLRQIVRQAVLVEHLGGWRQLGKAIARLEVPDAATGPRPPVSRRSPRAVSGEVAHD
jgi:hypothetical protein